MFVRIDRSLNCGQFSDLVSVEVWNYRNTLIFQFNGILGKGKGYTLCG